MNRVSNEREIRNLALIGFMGTGKTSVGRLVADQLHFSLLDTDDVVEARAGKSVSEIFEQEGEPAFREYERRVVEEISTRTKTVIATGGGLPTNPANLESLKGHSLVVCLWASADKIWERVRHQRHRPLLNAPDPPAKIRELLTARGPCYREADILVNTDTRSLKEVAQHVLHEFREAQRGRR